MKAVVRVAQLAALALFLLAVPPMARIAAQASNTYIVTDVNSSRFPVVQFRVRALDPDGHSLSGLTSANLALYENGKQVPPQSVKITVHDDGPLTIVFIVDQGLQSDYTAVLSALRSAISRLVTGGTFVDSRDRVELLVRENPGSGDRTTTRLGVTSHGQDLVDFVNGYTFAHSGGHTKGLEGAGDAINAMSQLITDTGTQDAAIVFIARAIEDPESSVAVAAAQNHARDARSKYITIHAIQASSGLPDQQPVQALASDTNGLFVNLTPKTGDALVDGIFQALSAQRAYYTVSYTSPSGLSGTRQITIGGPNKPTTGRTGAYQVKGSPPLVTLTPLSTVLRRTPIPGARAGQNAYSPLSIRARIDIAWTDGVTRPIQQIDLSVNGVRKDTKSASQLPPGTTSVEMVADLSGFTNPGANVATLSARVLDALSNEATADKRVTIEVEPPATPTPEPGSELALDNPIILVVLGLLALSVVIVVLIVFLLIRWRRPARTGNNAAHGAAKESGEPLATLFVLQGPAALRLQPIRLEHFPAVIGRDQQVSDITFYAGETSSVSRAHATLEHDDERGFSITDTGSSNGTSVNGSKLGAGKPHILRDGDEIVLGDMAKRGVKLRFAVGRGKRWVGGSDDRTQIGV